MPTTVCAGVGYNAVTVNVRDERGNPIAFGSVVTLTDGDYQETDSGGPVSISAAGDRGGRTYDIRVSKPHYHDVTVLGVKAPGGGCVTNGASANVTIPVTLTLAPGAPPVRSLHLVGTHGLLDRPPYGTSNVYTPYLDADDGVSRALTWSIVGDTASVGFDPLTGTTTYRCLPLSGYVTVTGRSVADPRVFRDARIAVQGHPAASNDPPCG